MKVGLVISLCASIALILGACARSDSDIRRLANEQIATAFAVITPVPTATALIIKPTPTSIKIPSTPTPQPTVNISATVIAVVSDELARFGESLVTTVDPRVAPPTMVPSSQSTSQPIRISGDGQQATSKFTLKEGLVLFKLTHNGTGHFGIWLLDSRGRRLDLLVNDEGNFDGSKAVRIEVTGSYLLDVSAGGMWEVLIEQ